MSDRPVLVTGAAGQLGRQLVDAFRASGEEVIALTRSEFDLADPEVGTVVRVAQPGLVVNAAAWTDVDGCARDPDRAMLLNGTAAGRLAAAAAEIGAAFIQVSTNEVFDGTSEEPYGEDARTNPINPYAASKLAGEHAVAGANPKHLIVRTAWIFGPGGQNFPTRIIAAARRMRAERKPLRVVTDEIGNPTWAPDLARAIATAQDRGQRGILHLAGEPAVSRHDWARVILSDMPDLHIEPILSSDYARPSAVPPRAVLSMGHARLLGIGRLGWEGASSAYAAELLAEGGA